MKVIDIEWGEDVVAARAKWATAKPDWSAAAEVLEGAHDVLLRTGVQCAETYNPDGNGGWGSFHEIHDVGLPNCMWEAIAIAQSFTYQTNDYPRDAKGAPLGPEEMRPARFSDYQRALRDVQNGSTPVGAALFHLNFDMRGPKWNDDEASVDDVFDMLKEGAKACREKAGTQ